MEILDIVDKNGIPTGKTIEREEAHRIGAWHRTASIWIVRKVDNKYQVLLQKRSANKDSYPGKYDTSSAGHIDAGDEPLESAIRELGEELGIKSKPEDFKFLGTFKNCYEHVFHGNMFRNNEVAFAHLYLKPVKIENLILQKEEVESVKWFDLEEAWQRVLDNDPAYCAPIGGLKLLRDYLSEI